MTMQLNDFREGRATDLCPPPRVLVCIPTLGGGGAERQIRLLARPLTARCVELSLFSRMTDSDLAKMSEAGVRCFPLQARGNHNPRLMVELFRAIKRVNPDIIHTFLPQMDILGGIAALATGRKWLLAERSSPAAYPQTAKNRLRAWLGRRAHTIIANNPAGLDVWPDHPHRHVIPNAVDLEAIEAVSSAPETESVSLTGRRIIVSVARLSAEKRLDRLLHAAELLKRDLPDILFVLLGDGPEEPRLRTLAAELGVQEHIFFAGYRSDVWSWLKRASAFVSTSAFEGHPNAVLEAAAAGVPQILSDIAMHRDAVGEKGAIFVRPDEPEKLAQAVLSLLTHPAAGRDSAAAARRMVEALSIDRAADELVDLYRQVVAGTRRVASRAKA